MSDETPGHSDLPDAHGAWISAAPTHVNGAPPSSEELPALSVRFLKHELRTPINHVIGYSEMLLEDLADERGSAEQEAISAIHAHGTELLARINAKLDDHVPDAIASTELIAMLRVGVQNSVDHILIECMRARAVAPAQRALDIAKILDGAARLAAFARSGRIRNSESEGV
jgi:signal transduction histidine kinase